MPPDIAQHAAPRIERVLLEHEAAVGAGAGDELAADQDAPAGRTREALQDAQQRGLAAARGPDDDEELARRDVEIDILQCHQPLTAAREFHTEILDRDRGGARAHGHSLIVL
jgi:hypothetical protein